MYPASAMYLQVEDRTSQGMVVDNLPLVKAVTDIIVTILKCGRHIWELLQLNLNATLWQLINSDYLEVIQHPYGEHHSQ